MFLHWGGKICCGCCAHTLVGLGISEMIFDSKSKIFLGVYCSRAKAFVGFNNHQVWVALYEYNCPAVMKKEIVADGEKSELRFQGFLKYFKMSLEWDINVPFFWFLFLADVNFWIDKRYYTLAAWKYVPNMNVSLKSLHALVNVEHGAERGGENFYPKAQQRL